MAFCEQCGKELAEGEKCTCTAAETPVAEAPKAEAAPAAEAPKTEAAPAAEAPKAEAAPAAEAPKAETTIQVGQAVEQVKKSVGKNPLVWIIAGGALVLLLLIGIVCMFTRDSYMSPVKDFMSAVNKRETNSIKVVGTLTPDFATKAMNKVVSKAKKSEDFQDMLEDSAEYLEEYYEEADDELGKWKLTFEKKKASKMDEDDLEDLQDALENSEDYIERMLDQYEDILDDDDDLEDFADDADLSEGQAKAVLKEFINYFKKYEKIEVTDAYEVKGKFVVKAGKDTYETDSVTLILIKVNGDWCYYGTENGIGSFDDDDEGVLRFLSNYLSNGYVIYNNFF